MANYSLNPTYFRVTWDQAAPTNYTGLVDTRAGGLDNATPQAYNSRISVTGTTSLAVLPVLADGDSMLINGVEVAFKALDTIDDIIVKINLVSQLTNVIAHKSTVTNYLTLTNSATHMSELIGLTEGTGALAALGFTAGYYKNFPCVVGDAFVAFANNDTFTINGVTVTMTAAVGLNQAGAVVTLNALTDQTGVIAVQAGNRIQLCSVFGQPFLTAGANATKLGFPAGVYGGSPSTLDQSKDKNKANNRWQMVVNNLEAFATPFMLNDVLGTGNFDGSDELTTISFTVGYERPDTLITEDELSPGTMLTGQAAVKRAVARGLIASYSGNAKLFDPTTAVKNNHAVRPNSYRIQVIQTDGIDIPANLATIEGNISVELIAYA